MDFGPDELVQNIVWYIGLMKMCYLLPNVGITIRTVIKLSLNN